MICYCEDVTEKGNAPWKATKTEFLKLRPDSKEQDMPNYCKTYINL